MNIISSATLAIMRSEYAYQKKWNKTAISLLNKEDLESLASEINSIALNSSINEKIGVAFRALEKDPVTKEYVICDMQKPIERNQDDSLLDGPNFLNYGMNYLNHIIKIFKNAQCEVLYYFYDLDLTQDKINHPEDKNKFIVEQIVPKKAVENYKIQEEKNKLKTSVPDPIKNPPPSLPKKRI